MARYQVIIVGGGPVGMALAVDLGQRGVSCVVLERHREVGTIPKGQGLRHRSVEHFYFWGCVDQLRSARLLPSEYPIGGVTAYRDLTTEYWYAGYGGSSPIGQYYFERNERLPQYLTEQVLRARAAELSSVELRFEATVTQVEQDEHGVRVTARSEVWPYDDEVLESDYVVGCDGARSITRGQLGINQHGRDFDTKMVLAVFSSPELHKGLERFGERTTYHVINPIYRGAWQFFGRVEVGRSFFYHGPVPSETGIGDEAVVHRAMEEAAGFAFPVEFEHIGFWNLRVEVADTYRSSRGFIAGDAAHSHPPYGGHGLNTGLEDVTNLGWKLSAALAGWGGEALLDSYSTERQPVFAETGEDVIARGILAERAWLERYDPDRDRAGFEAAWGARRTSGEQMEEYEPHYGGSPVVLGPPGSSIGVHSRHATTARAGHHLTPMVLSDGSNVFEHLGSGFTLLALDVPEAATTALESAAERAQVPLRVVRDSASAGREGYGARLVLVRPDQFVAFAGDHVEDPDALFSRVTGRA